MAPRASVLRRHRGRNFVERDHGILPFALSYKCGPEPGRTAPAVLPHLDLGFTQGLDRRHMENKNVSIKVLHQIRRALLLDIPDARHYGRCSRRKERVRPTDGSFP